MVDWKFYIDSPQKRALDLCGGSLIEGDGRLAYRAYGDDGEGWGDGYDQGYGNAQGGAYRGGGLPNQRRRGDGESSDEWW